MERTLDDLLVQKAMMSEPITVCLIGSTRFMDAYRKANLSETLAGRRVFTIGCDTKSDAMLHLTEDDKLRLDLLHLWKIDEAEEVLVLNVGGYVGPSTWREIEYAIRQGKELRWLEPPSDDLLQFVADSSRWTPVHPVFCIGIPDETLQRDLALAQKEAVFAPFGKAILVRPMSYGEVAELARCSVKPGETACLLINLEQLHRTDLSVDLALFAYEVSGKKPICIYIGKDASGKRAATVKYPSPR